VVNTLYSKDKENYCDKGESPLGGGSAAGRFHSAAFLTRCDDRKVRRYWTPKHTKNRNEWKSLQDVLIEIRRNNSKNKNLTKTF
jgi:hypothetical protein